MNEGQGGRQVKILLTGFSSFPGAPVNPTQNLVEAAQAGALGLSRDIDLNAVLLPTEYSYVTKQLPSLLAQTAPDIAVHFGLSQKAGGFTLERFARNEIDTSREDASGYFPDRDLIDSGGCRQALTGLPIDDIERVLEDMNLPVAFSDDAGGYVCNYLFYLVRQEDLLNHCAMSGFIHIPLLEGQADAETADDMNGAGARLSYEQLIDGAACIIKTCAATWLSNRR